MKKINQFIKFNPILKEKIWGGDKLVKKLNKDSDKKKIGESWEISGVRDNVSMVSNGLLKGKKLNELIEEYTSDLVGEKVFKNFGTNFPLLIKFIDANKALSIQVHPNDETAKERHDSLGKTEMWYVMESDKEASLIVGFKKETNEKEYLYHLKNKSLLDILNVDEVNKGDIYFIPAGRVHAIGAGVLLAEIQETSDITYRIYDWDRKDVDGNYRDLHTEEAIKVIDYTTEKSYKTNYTTIKNESLPIVSCQYFTTNILPVTKSILINNTAKDSFVIYMCVSGEVTFIYKNNIEKLIMGETLIVPACIKEFEINSDKNSELLEVFIK